MKSKKIPLESIGSAIFSFFNETIAYKRSSEPYSILYFLNGVEIHRIERVCTSKIKLLQMFWQIFPSITSDSMGYYYHLPLQYENESIIPILSSLDNLDLLVQNQS